MENETAISRRAFIAAGAGIAASAVLGAPERAPAAPQPAARARRQFSAFEPLSLKRIRIEAGAQKPFRAIQVSDTHLVRVDSSERDPRKVQLAASRYRSMAFGEHYLAEAVAEAKRDNAIMLHTGDMIDFVSNANLALAGRYFASADWFAAAGNHEFSQYVGEAKEDAAYKAQSYGRVSAAFPNDMTFASRVVNGVNFVAVDDVYYNLTEKQLGLMEKEIGKGLPVVLMCHVPFYTPAHYENMMKSCKGACSYQTGVPDGLVDTWKAPAKPLPPGMEWRDRRVQQRADAPTKEFVRYIKAQPLLKAVLCGHCHSFFQERFSPTAMQYVCGATFCGMALSIDIV